MGLMKGFKVVHLNVRSYFRKKDELYLLFKDYDVLCFTETWLTPMLPDNMLKCMAWFFNFTLR